MQKTQFTKTKFHIDVIRFNFSQDELMKLQSGESITQYFPEIDTTVIFSAQMNSCKYKEDMS